MALLWRQHHKNCLGYYIILLLLMHPAQVSRRCAIKIDFCLLTYLLTYLQEAHLSQRGLECFVSLNISQSHSRSLKITRGRLKWHPLSMSLVVKYSIVTASNNGVILKSRLAVIQNHWFNRSHTWSCYRSIVSMALSRIISKVKWDSSRKFDFFTPTCIGRPVERSPFGYRQVCFRKKLATRH